MLNIFCLWAQQTIAALPAGVKAQLTLGVESENSSARLDFDAPARLARVTCWNSGNFHLEILDVESGRDVLDQHGKIDSSTALNRSFQSFLDALGIALR
ncbi:immunity protein TriTu family protein [Duganella sp. PWIR1]